MQPALQAKESLDFKIHYNNKFNCFYSISIFESIGGLKINDIVQIKIDSRHYCYRHHPAIHNGWHPDWTEF